MEFVKSPLNYMGGKYRILDQIIPLFPNDISVFCDLFGGGFNVGVNVHADTIVYNDINMRICELFQYLYQEDTVSGLHNRIMSISWQYDLLRRDNPEGYYALRRDYNAHPDPLHLFVLIACGFSNQVRFNGSGMFNIPYGKRCYNADLQQRFQIFVDVLKSRDISFFQADFRDLLDMCVRPDFVYCDPPYLGSSATYNASNGWTEKDDRDLLAFLDDLTVQGVRWALSNNLKLENPYLHSWSDKYQVHHLDQDYSGCNYQKKDKSPDVEVLITNY